MNLNSLITGPARLGLSLGSKAIDQIRGRLGGGRGVDDETLQRDVEAEVFRSRKIARRTVQLEVVDGVVWLRGEVKTAAVVQESEATASAVPGVQRVENLLRVAKPTPRAKAQKRTTPKPAPRPRAATAPQADPAAPARPAPEATPAGAAPPPAAEPAPAPLAAEPAPSAEEHRPARRFSWEAAPAEEPIGTTGAAGHGGSPPAPFPSTGNGSSGEEPS